MNDLHHANIVLGSKDCKEAVCEILESQLNFKVQQNPDFLFLASEVFGIDEARNLERWAVGKPFLGDTKVAFLSVSAITPEAQNALLKVLEEPKAGTYFFINLESLGNILPTLLSRVRVLNFAQKNDLPNSVAREFFRSNIREKFALTRALSKNDTKNDMKDLIKNLEAVAYQSKASHPSLKNILTAKVCARARGSSPKMLLEWLACVL